MEHLRDDSETYLSEFDGTSTETKTIIWSELLNGEKATANQILGSEDKVNIEEKNCQNYSQGSMAEI